jgi:ADP-ribose pyrophosphatase YjhB (NUDIX family)
MIKRIRARLFHWYFLLRRPMTLGVRILVRDDAGRLLLVRHSYVAGWHLPGGGVERRETAEEAARKELFEEAAIEATGPFELAGFYANRQASPRDHVVVFLLGEWRQSEPFKPTREILEARFFAINELPPDIAVSTRRRLAELIDGEPRSAYW